jgi:hypothetical protein
MHPDVAREDPSGSASAAPPSSDLSKINWLVLPAMAVAFLILLWRFGVDGKSATASMWAFACLCAGGFVGFLFGIPRVAPPAEREPAAAARASTARSNTEGAAGALRGAGWQSNSNLVEISDWLTKIIVGLGLIHLKDVPSAAQRLAGHVAAGFGDAAPAQQFEAFLMALLIAFTLLGFVTGYLYTRIFLQGALRRAEDAMLRAEQQQAMSDKLDREIADAGNDVPITLAAAPDAVVEAALPSSSELQQAERVQKRLAVQATRDTIVDKMMALAREYEQVRSTMTPGDARTRSMTRIVVQMRRIGLAALPALRQFSESASPGERLAAIAILQTRFDPAYIHWLAECVINEVPFVGFHAAIALFQASKIVGEPARSELQVELERVKKALAAKGYADANRDKLIDDALAEL